MTTKLVKLTHFCQSCGWIDDIEVTARETENKMYVPVETDKTPECPECQKRTVYALNMKNAPRAIGYLLRALR